MNSTSKVIRSSDAPIRVGHHRRGLGEDLARRTLSARPGGVGGCEKPIARCVSALSYVERSTDSVIRISFTRSHEPLSTIRPGSSCRVGAAAVVEPPRSQAERIGRVHRALLPPVIHPDGSSAHSSSTLGHSGL